jgi:hypothetical protein
MKALFAAVPVRPRSLTESPLSDWPFGTVARLLVGAIVVAWTAVRLHGQATKIRVSSVPKREMVSSTRMQGFSNRLRILDTNCAGPAISRVSHHPTKRHSSSTSAAAELRNYPARSVYQSAGWFFFRRAGGVRLTPFSVSAHIGWHYQRT